jgi:hypothetical protein
MEGHRKGQFLERFIKLRMLLADGQRFLEKHSVATAKKLGWIGRPIRIQHRLGGATFSGGHKIRNVANLLVRQFGTCTFLYCV